MLFKLTSAKADAVLVSAALVAAAFAKAEAGRTLTLRDAALDAVRLARLAHDAAALHRSHSNYVRHRRSIARIAARYGAEAVYATRPGAFLRLRFTPRVQALGLGDVLRVC